MSPKGKSLLFVTYHFPYLPGENFIESEIGYLADTFDHVYIYPARCLWWASSEPPRQVPENVTVWDPVSIPVIFRLYWMLLSLLSSPFFLWKQYKSWPGDRSLPTVGLLDQLKSAFKIGVTANALRYFADRDYVDGRLVGYSYWRDFGAAAIAFSREKIGLSKLFVRCHRVDIYQSERWPEEALIHHNSDGVFPVSTDGSNYLIDYKGFDFAKISVQRLGVNLPDCLSSASSDGVLRILSCSNIVPVKRVQLIADVVGRIPGAVEWTHIGTGPDLAEVQRVTDAYDSGHSVNFVGRLANSEVLSYFEKHPVDLFINLSESEGVPVSIMEAFSYGVPVVASDVGGTSEIVDSSNGCVVSVDMTATGIVDCIVSWLRSSNPHEDPRNAARMRAEEMCSSERNYTEFCSVLTN